jgi:polyhydroxybutyrate depolymerase
MALTAIFLNAALKLLGPERWELDVDGQKRTAQVVEGPDDGPVILAFHGHGGQGRIIMNGWRLHERMPEATVIYPDGLPTATGRDPQGLRPGWQSRDGQEGDRDVKFITALRKKIGTDRPTLLIGHSNGAALTVYLWGREDADFKGVVEIAGGGMPRAGSAHIPMMVVAGQDDQIVPFANQQRFIDGMKRILRTGEGKTEGLLTTYTSSAGVPFWTYVHPGAHGVPQDSLDAAVKFFRTCLSR